MESETKKTRSIRSIEQKMEDMDAESIRYKVLQDAKGFKTSWIELGQVLYSVWKDKLYKEWGYQEFDSYTAKEIGIRKQTALKLLRSYSFLEKESPQYLQKEHNDESEPDKVPTYEAVDLLRRTNNNKELEKADYNRIKKYVLEDGKDAQDVKKDITSLMKQREDLQPEEARKKKRVTVVKRFVNLLKSVKKEIVVSKMLSGKIIKKTEELIFNIEQEFPLD